MSRVNSLHRRMLESLQIDCQVAKPAAYFAEGQWCPAVSSPWTNRRRGIGFRHQLKVRLSLQIRQRQVAVSRLTFLSHHLRCPCGLTAILSQAQLMKCLRLPSPLLAAFRPRQVQLLKLLRFMSAA